MLATVYTGQLRACIFFLVVLLAAASTSAFASSSCDSRTEDCVAIGEWRLGIGVGLGVRTNPVVEGDNLPIVLIPEISYYGERFFWDTTQIGYNLVETPRHSLNALVTLGLDYMYFRDWSMGNFVIDGAAGHMTFTPAPTLRDTDENDSNDIGAVGQGISTDQGINNPNPGDKDGPNEFFHSSQWLRPVTQEPSPSVIQLDKRRMAALAGLDYSFYWQGTVLGLQWLQDISNVHHGQEVRLGVDHRWAFAGSRFGVAAGAVWQSHQVADYYYGVQPHEVLAAGEVSYAPGSALSPYVRLDWQHPLTQHWSLQATLHHKWLDRRISRSPIIDSSGSTSIFVGGFYHL